MSKVVPIGGQPAYPNLKVLMHDVMEKHPRAMTGIVIVFEGEDQDMWTYYKANDQQLAYASVRLASFANTGGEE